MRVLLTVLLAAFFLSSCERSTTPQPAAEVKRYKLKGKVISVDRANKKAKIDHEEIPGYMPAMEMDFPIKEDWVWNDLTPGSEIRAEMVVDNTATPPYWLEQIGILANTRPDQAPPPPPDERFAQIGKEVPDFTLTNQDGKRISLKDFRGHPLAITFIYAECPLPDYCIKMSTLFSDAANRIMQDAEAKGIYRLLSISFDPARDTPEKLRSYGLGYLGKDAKPDFSVWQLAVGSETEVRAVADFFGLRYEVDENDKTQINHSLRTAIISPEGKVTKIIPGNEWTVNDLIREMKASTGN
jgi:protein SCO1/2